MKVTDFLVIGGGIAGASAASELAEHADVTLLESESAPGYHSTGRSAAYFANSYGNEVVRTITRASEAFLITPPAGFSDVALLHARGRITVGREDQLASLEVMVAHGDNLELVGADEVRRRVEILENVAFGVYEAKGADIDVDALLQGFLRRFRERGGELKTSQQVTSLQQVDGGWRVSTEDGEYSTPVVINAAGAWADQVANMAGLQGLNIEPKRRTAILIDVPGGRDASDWPMVIDVDEQFYFKADTGQLLVSPADETPSPACDAQPEELDIAIAVDRFTTATGQKVSKVNHSWAGLRSFAPDRTFIAGIDPRATGFFWLAGQGGYGVQSSPGMARIVNHLVTGAELEPALVELLPKLAPERFLN